MSSYHRCPKCNSDHMMDGAYLADALGPRVVVGVERHPEGGRLPEPASTGIHARVCGSCGFVEFFANKPGELYEAYSQAPKGRSG